MDIVQATGRAMRRAPGKALGYVLVPLYVELAAGESVDDAVSRADFDEVWDVLQSLQEQDEALAELIRHFGEQKGRGKGFDDRGFADRIDFGGPRLSLQTLRSAVTTRCLETLCSSWDTRLGKLKDFRERFGHCNVEAGWNEDPALAGWVSAQRLRRKRGVLDDDRIRCLDELGFVWDFQKVKAQETWMKWYQELEAYVREHGNPDVPRTYSNTRLASWVWKQRQRRNGTLKRHGGAADVVTAEQVGLLDGLGFRWDMREAQWMAGFEALKAFKAKHGHCNLGLISDVDARLYSWAVHNQRRLQSQGKLGSERKAKLDAIGFKWSSEVSAVKWHEMYNRLKHYHAEHGDTDVSRSRKNDVKLATWISRQRQRRKNNAISEEEIRLLDDLGIAWKLRDVGTWEDRLAEVAAYTAQHGHCKIPVNYLENPKLGRFVNAMRSQRSRGKLSADRVARLEAIGFVWASAKTAEVLIGEKTVSAVWKVRFDELLAYKKAYGDCNVPAKWHENEQLGNWVSMQRQLKRREQLHPEYLTLLDESGFIWQASTGQKAWEERYADLLKFKEAHGRCDVPRNYPDDPALGVWVSNQRSNKKRGTLAPEHERLLNEAGFVWRKNSSAAASSKEL